MGQNIKHFFCGFIFKRVKICCLLSSICYILYAPMAVAAVDTKLVGKAEVYLNSITGIIGEFSQVAGEKKDNGKFYMLRPGRIRLDYTTSPIQLISNGQDLYFVDKALDQITTVPLTSTPAGILIRKNINLSNADIVVSETKSANNSFALRMHIKGQEGIGYMIVNFSESPVSLQSWTVVDATGNAVDVVFKNMNVKDDFQKNFFQLEKMKTTSSTDDIYYD